VLFNPPVSVELSVDQPGEDITVNQVNDPAIG